MSKLKVAKRTAAYLFYSQDMCAMFDAQLEGIYSILDDQLGHLNSKRPTKDVVSNAGSQPCQIFLIPDILAISSSLRWAWQLGVHKEQNC